MTTCTPLTGANWLTEVRKLIQQIRVVSGKNETVSQYMFSNMPFQKRFELYVLAAFMTKEDADTTVLESINDWLQNHDDIGRWNFFHFLFRDFTSIIQSLAEQNPEMAEMLKVFDEKNMCLAVCNGTYAGTDIRKRVRIPPEVVAFAMHHGITQVLELDIQQAKETANKNNFSWMKPSRDEYINKYKSCLTSTVPLDELPTATVDWLGANCD